MTALVDRHRPSVAKSEVIVTYAFGAIYDSMNDSSEFLVAAAPIEFAGWATCVNFSGLKSKSGPEDILSTAFSSIASDRKTLHISFCIQAAQDGTGGSCTIPR